MSSLSALGERSRPRRRRARGRDFVAGTISGVTSTLERAVFDQELAALPGMLQSADPRAKTVSAALLLVAVAFSRRLSTVLLACAVAALLALLSRVPLSTFVRRVWFGIPMFAVVVALPSLFIVPGRPLLTILDTHGTYLAVSDNGLAGATLFVSRVGASVSVALLLISTTRWTDLLRALRVLGLPESMVVVLGMTYRYLFLFLHAANNLFLARASRTVGETSGSERRRWAAGAAGTLVGRSVKMSGDVLLAMRSRGFSGEVRTAADPRMHDEDWLLLALGVVLSAGLLLLDSRLV